MRKIIVIIMVSICCMSCTLKEGDSIQKIFNEDDKTCNYCTSNSNFDAPCGAYQIGDKVHFGKITDTSIRK